MRVHTEEEILKQQNPSGYGFDTTHLFISKNTVPGLQHYFTAGVRNTGVQGVGITGDPEGTSLRPLQLAELRSSAGKNREMLAMKKNVEA